MSVTKKLKATASRFINDKAGNFATMACVVLPAIFAGAGMMVDGSRLYNGRANLLQALDAAVTSTARDITTGKIDKEDAKKWIEIFLQANASTSFADPEAIDLTSVIVDQVNGTVEASATYDMSMAFPFFSMAPSRAITVGSAAVYSDRTIEVAMMLDITGSMGGQKLTDLKLAATNAATLFLEGQDPTNPRVRVAVVPYADAVNTGQFSPFVFVETKDGPKDPPSLYDPLDAAYTPDKCATERKNGYGQGAINDLPPSAVLVNRDYRLTFCPDSPILPLTADLDKVNASINGFQANGYTAGHVGILWTWYMLSPKWAKFMPAGSAPEPYKTKGVEKFAILMTDGLFNTAYAGVPDGERTRGGQTKRSRDAALLTCDRMKKEGIEIFTIGFMLNSTEAEDIMAKCASSSDRYYDAKDGDALMAAFKEIAANIERLAITR